MFSLPVRLVVVVALAFSLANRLPFDAVLWAYTASVILKDALMAILPFVVFGYLASSILSLRGKATATILGVFGLVILSNLASVIVAYGSADLAAAYLKRVPFDAIGGKEAILPLWRLPDLASLTADKAMISGIVVGFAGNALKLEFLNKLVFGVKSVSTKILNAVFIPLLPLYVFGFVLKIGFEGALSALATAYAPVFFLSLAVIYAYLFLAYAIGCGGNLKKTVLAIKNMAPAWITGFSTMSSAAALPVTERCVEKNLNDQRLTHFVVPATANVHMVGDGINVTLTALALLVMAGLKIPSFVEFLPYLGAYVFTKFSGSGVPGGGMLVLLPIVEKHLGLSADLCGLVATLYILQDSLMTASNVAGNGALALIVRRVFARTALTKGISTGEDQAKKYA